VAAGDDEAHGGEVDFEMVAMSFEEDGVDVAFEVVDGDERFVECGGESFGVGDADEKCADEAGALGDGDSVKVVVGEVSLGERFADYRDNLAEVFARSQFGDDAAVFLVNIDLRGDHVGEDVEAVGDDGGGGFVAGGFDGEDFCGHVRARRVVTHLLWYTDGRIDKSEGQRLLSETATSFARELRPH
jgi:hypothetical protein